MIKLPIDLTQPWPSYLENWSNHYKLKGRAWDDVYIIFNDTTGGNMVGIRGSMTFDLVFDQDHNATLFLLKWS